MPARATDVVEECAARALQLLHENLAPTGIMAAGRTDRSERRGYTGIFARDAAICALAMARSGDRGLREAAQASLATLARHQAANGQIPKYVDPDRDDADFWYLGCIDATLWWLIAVALLDRWDGSDGLAARHRPECARAIDWLACQEHQRIWLLQQNEASDWADIMPRSGFVLYTNALWCYVKRLYQLPRLEESVRHFNYLFHPFAKHLEDYRRLRLLTHYVRNRSRSRDLYLSFVNLASWGEEGDVFGNLLAVLFDLPESAHARRIVRAIGKAQEGAKFPVRATCEPISRDSALWRTYMGRHRQNLEHQYHNGGIWPMVGGFWVMALSQLGQHDLARRELERLAHANAANDWQFNEWFHGLTGAAGGMPRQSWNAAAFLLARQSLDGAVLT